MNFDIINIQDDLFKDSLPCGIALCAGDDNITVYAANSYFYEAIGKTNLPAANPEPLRSYVYPSDFSKIKEALSKCDNQAIRTINLRFFNKGYSTSWYQVSVRRFSEETFILAFFNIDEQKKAETLLKQEKNLYYSAFEVSNSILLEYNCREDVLTVSESASKLTDNRETIHSYTKMHKANSKVHPEDRNVFFELFTSPPKVNSIAEAEIRMRDVRNEYVWVKFACKTIFDSEGKPWLVIGILTDINEEKLRRESHLNASNTDPMTGLFNRNAMKGYVGEYLKNNPTSVTALLMIDLDDFKSVNDHYGHITGDEILITVASGLKSICKSSYLIGRVGGDEFSVFIPDVSNVDINAYADSLCSNLSKICFKKLGAACTVSIGVYINDKIRTYEELYKFADNALRTAKKNGKARFEIYSEKNDFPSVTVNELPYHKGAESSEIICSTVSMLSDLQKIPESLEYIGKYVNLDRICIFTNADESDMSKLEWDYNPTNGTSALKEGQIVSNSLFPVSDFSTGIFSSTDVEDDFSQATAIPGLMNTPVYLQCEIAKDGIHYGYVAFASFDSSRVWIQREHSTITYLSKLLAEAMHTQQRLSRKRQNSKNLSELINISLSFPIFVIKKSDNSVLYHNDKIKLVLPEIEVGANAHDFYNRHESDPDSKEKLLLSFKSSPNREYPATVTPFMWDEDEAFIICLRDPDDNDFEHITGIESGADNPDIELVSKLSLMRTHEHVYSINLKTDEVTVIYAKNGSFPVFENITPVDRFLEIAKKYTLPSEHDILTDTYTPASLREKFNAGIDEFTTEYQKIPDDGNTPIWVRAQVYITCRKGEPYIAVILLKEISERKRLEQERIANERKYRCILENNYYNVVEADLNSDSYIPIFKKKNTHFVDTDKNDFDYKPVETPLESVVHPDELDTLKKCFNHEYIRKRLDECGSFYMEFRRKAVDGGYCWVRASFCRSDNPEKALVMFRDISEEKAKQEALDEKRRISLLNEESKYYRRIFDHSNTIVFEWNESTEERYISPRIADWFVGNYDGRDLFDILLNDGTVHNDDKQIIYNIIDDINKDISHTDGLVRLLNHEHTYEWCRIQLDSVTEQNGLKRITGTIRSIRTEFVSGTSSQFTSPTETDTLTGLYTADTFYERCEAFMSRNADRQYYIVVMDINHFKLINDVHGEEGSNKILQYIADMLRRRMSHSSIYARLSDDLFAMLISLDEEMVIRLLDDISLEMQSYPLDTKVMLSYGIYEVKQFDVPVSVMCARAKMALQTVKGSYFSRYAFFDNALRDKIISENQMESVMYESLDNGDFKVYLQPKFGLRSNRLSGAEALIRWESKDMVYSPGHFIPLFERNGFIRNLDRYVWRSVCEAMKEWISNGFEMVPISVNVSRIHAYDDTFSDDIIKLVEEYDIPPSLLQLEITESAFSENDEQLIAHIKNLREHGFILAMDDFGSGYSSLNMLKSVPIDVIKLDRGFIDGYELSENSRTVLACTIDMVKRMNLSVLAEGVETDEQAQFLFDCGCDEIQGYFYAKPVSPEKFYEEYLKPNGKEETND